MIPEFEFIGYDIDGESVQSEQLRVFKSEGFYSYQTGTAAASLTAVEEADGSVLFTGPGTNFDEANTSGAVKLVYKNSSTVTLQFETETSASSPFPNAIFQPLTGTGSYQALPTQRKPTMSSTLVTLPIVMVRYWQTTVRSML